MGVWAWQHHKVDTIPWGDEKSQRQQQQHHQSGKKMTRDGREEEKKSETEAKFKINFMTHFS